VPTQKSETSELKLPTYKTFEQNSCQSGTIKDSSPTLLPMKRAKLQAATVGGTPDDIEQAFYEALQNADIQQLMACWAEEDDIVCVHPGGPRIIGSGAIRGVFEAMFANGSVQAFPERIHKIESLACAVHHLVERVEVIGEQGPQHAWVIATNVYQKTPQGWRMVAHHASPGTARDAADQGVKPTVLH
jgi:ketosteroid isomerase-like protein